MAGRKVSLQMLCLHPATSKREVDWRQHLHSKGDESLVGTGVIFRVIRCILMVALCESRTST